jgi:hypothetical protein
LLRRLGIGLVCAVLSYPIGVVVGMILISQCSSNVHDRGMEAAMTGAFFSGPLAAVIGFVIGLVKARPGGALPRSPTEEATPGAGPPGSQAP